MPVTELNIPKSVMYIHILVGVLLSFTIDLLSAFGGGGGGTVGTKRSGIINPNTIKTDATRLNPNSY